MTSRLIEIIGGGLAGLSLGIALRRAGVPVALHEAGAYPRHRVCGEFIAGLEGSTIERLGLVRLPPTLARNVGYNSQLPSLRCGTFVASWQRDSA